MQVLDLVAHDVRVGIPEHAPAGYVACICRPCMQEPRDDPVSAAREAIWDLYHAGLMDEDHATAALLAISIGLRRMQARRAEHSEGAALG